MQLITGLIVLIVLSAAGTAVALVATSTLLLVYEEKEASGLFACQYFTGTGVELKHSKTGCERFALVNKRDG